MIKRLLSTKVLNTVQEERLKAAGWHLTQYNAISIALLPVGDSPKDRVAIFSSQHAVRACLSGPGPIDLKGVPCLCVGGKSKALLEENGIEVLEVAGTATALAGLIAQEYSDKTFVYYCGDRRLDVLPEALERTGVDWKECIVYNTALDVRKWDTNFDGILFFSPSGVESYMVRNTLQEARAYCIGNTTAAEAKKHTDRILIAAQPTLDALVTLAAGQQNPVNP